MAEKEICGWAGKVLWVDLSSGSIKVEPISHYAGFIGGRGIAQRILFEKVSPEVGPLDAANHIIFATGPLNGTLAPSCSRLSVNTKNVLTGGTSSSSVGGHLAAELKYAGVDILVVSGMASSPVYISIRDDLIEIRDAPHLWGKDTWETEELIKDELGDENLRVGSIGPAGENLVKVACFIVDRARSAAWGGSGAVMGSKKLKAVAVRGTNPVRIANTATFMAEVARARAKIERSMAVNELRKGGTHHLYGVGGRDGTRPQGVRNLQDEYWEPEKTSRIRENVFKRFEVRRLANFNCFTYCSHFYSLDEGRYSRLMCEGLQANTVRAFGSNLDITEPDVILKAQSLSSRLGLDQDGAATSIGWAFECFEKGILTEKDTDGLALTWGNGQALIALLEKMALRDGFGNILAEGARNAAKIVGKGSDKYAIHAKGTGLNEQGLRSAKGWALGIITSTRGGGHLNGAPGCEHARISAEAGRSAFGVSTAGDPLSYEGKAELVVWHEKYKAVVDCLGMCYYTSFWTDVNLLGPDDYARLFSAATGVAMSGDEMMSIGRRIHNIEKAFNTLHAGFTRNDDLPPPRLMTEPVKAGPFRGEVLERPQWEELLDEYYSLHGWDRASGWQTRRCLEELGLSEAIEKLSKAGRLL